MATTTIRVSTETQAVVNGYCGEHRANQDEVVAAGMKCLQRMSSADRDSLIRTPATTTAPKPRTRRSATPA